MEDTVKTYGEQYSPAGTESTELLAFAQYTDLEKAGDRAASKIKEGFMEMGCVLKTARDTDILVGSVYADYEEFGKKRYGLDKGTVSRYIRIVERFSVGGNSNILQEGYKNIGFTKLSLMLHMPDAIAEEITESYSKQEVQEIREEVEAERRISDIEVAIEAAEAPQEEGDLLEQAVRQLGRERPELFRKLGRAAGVPGTSSAIMDILAPQGDAVYMVRIPGTGRLMLAVSGTSVSVTKVRSGEKEKYTAEELVAAVAGVAPETTGEPAAEPAGAVPEEPEGAGTGAVSCPGQEKGSAMGHVGKTPDEKAVPVQQKEKRKESKVIKAVPPKQQKTERAVADTVHPGPEAPLAGQMEVMDYPEAYPMGDAVCGDPGKQIPDVHYEEIPEDNQEEVSGGEAVPAEMPVPATGIEKQLPVVEPAENTTMNSAHSPETEEATGGSSYLPGTEEAAGGSSHLPGTVEAAGGSSHLRDTPEDPECIRMEANGCLERLRKTFSIWDGEIPSDFLAAAHRDAVNLAAAIEKLMDLTEPQGN